MGVEPSRRFPGWHEGIQDPNKAPTRPRTSGTIDPADYIGIVVQTWPKGSGVQQAAAIAWRESRGTPSVTNTTPVNGGCSGPGSRHATGMFQIVPACHPTYDAGRLLTDPLYNSTAASEIQARNGWGPWETAPDVDLSPGHGFPGAQPTEDWLYWWQGAQVRGYMNGDYVQSGAMLETGIAPVDDAARAVGGWGEVASLLTSWSTWRRVLFVTAGAGLVIAGAAAISADIGGPSLPLPGPAGAALKIGKALA